VLIERDPTSERSVLFNVFTLLYEQRRRTWPELALFVKRAREVDSSQRKGHGCSVPARSGRVIDELVLGPT
jgi:hypothetical protein